MPSRRLITGVCAGLAATFTSRNNDVDGYWAVGQLYRHALAHGTKAVVLDALSAEIFPSGAAFAGMANAYRQRLGEMLGRVGRSLAEIAAAKVTLHFEVAPPPSFPLAHRAGAMYFVCEAQIQDSRGRHYRASAGGWCHPHDPTRESRSTRV